MLIYVILFFPIIFIPPPASDANGTFSSLKPFETIIDVLYI